MVQRVLPFLRRTTWCLLVLCVAGMAHAQPTPAPQTTWYLAEGATSAFFEEDVLVANPNATAADIEISASIRRAIMDQAGMSTNAQNCKIITEAGVVTLRGVVDSQGEKDAIASIAHTTPGVLRVVDELQVRSPGA